MIQTDAYKSIIGGGENNTIQTGAPWSTIGGGYGHTIQTSAHRSTIGGGENNTIQTNGAFATIPGGHLNSATNYAFAAGRQAKANHTGAFVWADSMNADFASSANDQFLIRAAGFVGINKNNPATALDVNGTVTATAFSSTGGTLVVGTTDNQPLELKVNGLRALRLEQAVDAGGNARPNVIGGATNNGVVTFGSFIGGGFGNSIQINAFGSTIGGGFGNSIQTNAFGSTIGGGFTNTIFTNATLSSIGGGNGNKIETFATSSTIGGGGGNTIRIDATYSTIGGGDFNAIGINADRSTIGGGLGNTIPDDSDYATIPGGYLNSATSYAFAAGNRAKANHTGAFVWADSTDADFASSANNQFNVRASGGTRIFSNAGATIGATLAPGSSSWTILSDRNAKENFTAVDGVSVLEKVAALPLTTWNYKTQDKAIRHIGPMAQDFKAAFGLGESDTGISTIDTDGVALAAIQGLNQKLEAQARAKDAEIESLKQDLAGLKKLVESLAAGQKGGAK